MSNTATRDYKTTQLYSIHGYTLLMPVSKLGFKLLQNCPKFLMPKCFQMDLNMQMDLYMHLSHRTDYKIASVLLCLMYPMVTIFIRFR